MIMIDSKINPAVPDSSRHISVRLVKRFEDGLAKALTAFQFGIWVKLKAKCFGSQALNFTAAAQSIHLGDRL